MAERTNAAALKAVTPVSSGVGGSNPPLSAAAAARSNSACGAVLH